jgi:hypothetical protein
MVCCRGCSTGSTHTGFPYAATSAWGSGEVARLRAVTRLGKLDLESWNKVNVRDVKALYIVSKHRLNARTAVSACLIVRVEVRMPCSILAPLEDKSVWLHQTGCTMIGNAEELALASRLQDWVP